VQPGRVGPVKRSAHAGQEEAVEVAAAQRLGQGSQGLGIEVRKGALQSLGLGEDVGDVEVVCVLCVMCQV